ncbi:MAG TPA: cyclic nucleotide-binding domain-containing protein, partial [Ramlibacter sp.]
LRGQRDAIALFRPHGALFFGTADQVARQLAATDAGTRFCILDLSRVTTVDATACEIIAAGARSQAAAGVQPLLAGIAPDSPRCRELVALGLSFPAPRAHWFADADRALEHAEAALLRERSPQADAPPVFRLADTVLAAGMPAGELQQLQACLREVQAPAGPLFSHGEPGGSLFLIAEGQVEIRIAGARDGDHARLAALYPGALFGEMSLLLAQRRTADAVCITPSRLLELDGEGLALLEQRSPKAYARVMRNLAVQIAHRLDLATGLVRTLQ